MQHVRKKKRLIAICVAVVILLTSAFFDFGDVSAASLTNVKDLVSTSNLAVAANHEVHFSTSIDVGVNGYFEVVFPAPFGDVSTGVCSGPNASLSTTVTSARCTYSSAPGATSTIIYIPNVDNPISAGSQIISIKTYNSLDQEQESIEITLFFVEKVTMQANVLANLSFEMGTSTGITNVNGIPITGSSTLTTLPFGDLVPNSSSTLAHTLSIATNAKNGFSCTVQQNGDLANGSGDTINSFKDAADGTGTVVPDVWSSPSAVIDSKNTYGHYGVTTDDLSLSSLDFSGSKYIGLDGVNTTEIMYHDGPADGETLGSGLTHVAYSLEISSLQEPGDYENTIIYICTGNY